MRIRFLMTGLGAVFFPLCAVVALAQAQTFSVSPIHAELSGQATTYTIHASGELPITYAWEGNIACGNFTAQDNQAIWSRSTRSQGTSPNHNACPLSQYDYPGTIQVTVTDALGNKAVCGYSGSQSGDGEACRIMLTESPSAATTHQQATPTQPAPVSNVSHTPLDTPVSHTATQKTPRKQPAILPAQTDSEIQASPPPVSNDQSPTFLHATIARILHIVRNLNFLGDQLNMLFVGMATLAFAGIFLFGGWTKDLFRDMEWWQWLIMILLILLLILAILLVVVAFWGEWLLMALVFLAMIAIYFLVWFLAWLMEFYANNPWLALLLALILLIILIALAFTPVGVGILAIIGEVLLCVLAFLILVLLIAAAIGLWERFKTYAKKNVARWKLICAMWDMVSSKTCAQWETQVDKQCAQYAEEVKTECIDWAENRYKQCCTWWPCSWLCDAWVWVTEKICMAWKTVKYLVCVAWKWVSTLVCKLWVWVTTKVCKLWVWVLEWAAS